MREMKDSDVEWIGKIPQGWTVSKLKYSSQFFNGDRGKNYPSGNDLVDDGVIFLTSNNLHEDVLDTSYENSKYITEERYNILGGAKLRINDIVFCLRGSVGNCSINKTETQGTVASSLMTIRPQQSNADFVNYMLHSEVTYSQTRLFVNGSCAENLSADNVANYYFVEPPLAEQKQIATYLHSKCANIDTIISDIQLQIELLQEYKQSVITEAVTKGLDKNVAMKNSGIDYIGNIPLHWHISKQKYVNDFYNGDRGKNYPSGNDLVDDGVIFLTSNNLHSDILDTSSSISKYITEARYHILGGAKLQKNDIVFCLRGSVGICSINKTESQGTIASSLMTIRPRKIHADFLNYLLHSEVTYAQTRLSVNGSCADNLSADNVANYYFPKPPLDEQEQIVNYLDKQCDNIDATIADKQKQLDTLTEYKKSLIYEYVTGKKEVPADA